MWELTCRKFVNRVQIWVSWQNLVGEKIVYLQTKINIKITDFQFSYMIISKQINKQKNPPWCLEWSSFKGNSGNHSNNFPDMLSDKQNIQIPIFLQAESFIYLDSFSNSFTLCLFSLFISAMSSVVEDKVLSVCFRGFFLTLPANF